jgi:hypothetical protein
MRSPISSEGIDVICVFSQYNAEAKIIAAISAAENHDVLSLSMAEA